MTRSPERANGKPASALRADAGFTLIEVIVAIVLIGASLLTVVGAASAAFGFQAVARQQQVATTIATKKMEDVRALPWTVVAGGMSASTFAGDPNVVDLSARPGRPHTAARYALAKCGSTTLAATEDIPTGALAIPAGVLNPHRVTGGATVDGIDYSWSTYITKPSAGDPYHATVCVTWTWKGATRSSMVQSWIWSPQGPGCVGRPITAVGGPCVSVSATVPDGAVSIDITHVSDSNRSAQLSFALAGAVSQLSLADKTTATASYTSARQSGAETIDERTIVTADDEDTSAIASFAETTAVSLSAMPSDAPTGWLYPSAAVSAFGASSLWVQYLAGQGQASTSAVGGGAQCPQPVGYSAITAKNAVCASSAVKRPLLAAGQTGKWIDTRFHIGDGFYIQPFGITSGASEGYKFGTYAVAGGGSVDAKASREMTALFAIGGVSTGYNASPATQTFKSLALLYVSDAVSLSGGAGVPTSIARGSAISPTYLNASNVTTDTPCVSTAGTPSASWTGASTILSTAGSTGDQAYGCTYATTSGSETIQVKFRWGWTYTPGSTYDSGASSVPRTVSSTAPSIDVTLYVTRTYCTQFGNGPSGRSTCKNASTTRYDDWRFDISISLGALSVAYDKRA